MFYRSAVRAHNMKGQVHFFTLHSWIGIIAIVLFYVQVNTKPMKAMNHVHYAVYLNHHGCMCHPPSAKCTNKESLPTVCRKSK